MQPNPSIKKSPSWTSYIVPALITLYLNLGLLGFAWILLDISTGSFNVFKWAGITLPPYPDYIVLLKLVSYAAIGGAFGGIVFGMQNLWRYTTRGEFKIIFVGDYIFRPFGSAALAVVIFALIRGGVLSALGAEPTTGATTSVSSFSAFAIGFLAGFGSYQVMNKLDVLIKQFFGKAKDDKPSAPPKAEN